MFSIASTMLCRISLSSLAILALKGAALVTAVSLANNPLFKRQDASTHGSEFKMYAYGTGIPGLEVFYGDGMNPHEEKKKSTT